MTFTKREQELLIQMFLNDKFRLTANGQKIYKSQWFFDVVCKLKKAGLVESFKSGKCSIYQLTDDGLIVSFILSKQEGHKKNLAYSVMCFL